VWLRTLGRWLWGGAFHVSEGGDKNTTRNILVPPLEKFCRCFLCFRCRVGLEKVNNELVKLFIAEPIIMAHPMGSVREGKVELGGCKLGREIQRASYMDCRICNSLRGDTPIHPMVLCIICSPRRACPSAVACSCVVVWHIMVIFC